MSEWMENNRQASWKKSLWQLIKFALVSSIVTVIQLVLVNVLLWAMKGIKTPLPAFLAAIFNEDAVGKGNANWGYVLPFFLSNAIANVYGWFQNRKTTFKSDAGTSSFVIYFIVIAALILFSTWLQGVIVHAIDLSDAVSWIKNLAPTIAALSAGMLQFAVIFPLEKFVLLKEKKQ